MRLLALLAAVALTAAPTPPAGFTALYNGVDLTGWRGGDTSDHRAYLAMPPEKRTERDAIWTADMQQHWKAAGDELLNDGKGKYATTVKEYGDFELTLEYNMAPLGDSGIYLRGVPQLQIWDPANPKEKKNGADKGSGALWNNSATNPGKFPLVLADKPPGEWNTLRVVMVGSRVSVWLNGQQTVDHAILENYYDRKIAVPAKGPISLQTHGAPIRWRNVFIREIPGNEANQLLAAKQADGFKPIFNGKDLTEWKGATDQYEVVDGAIFCKPNKGGNLYHQDDLTDFVARLEFKVPTGGNNGLCIRFPGTGNTAYVGMCECQILDDNYDKVRGKLDPRQVHGSAYGMVAAQRGYQRPIGEWNFQEVTVKGSTIKVELNGFIILDADLSKVDMATVMGKSAHPGKDNTHGFFGFAGHGDAVGFRALSIKTLTPEKK
ncbi:hypothetical protein LBMAG55_17440 [Verrucomicrobiota bacterium]|nr:hypothetical protein LBMAG55_17440 [Verrucomicrobiota bacterium]